MASHLHNLDRESILLMHLAGELSAEDQAEVEAMLSTDVDLRRQFEELRGLTDNVCGLLAGLDTNQPLPAPAASTVRKVSRAISQWQTDKLSRQPADAPVQRRFGWLATTGMVAAVLLVGFFILWSRVDDGKNPSIAFPGDGKPDPHETDITLTEQIKQDQIAEASESFYPAISTDADEQLSSAEREMKAMAVFSDAAGGEDEAVTP
jgi:hypothetical protein